MSYFNSDEFFNSKKFDKKMDNLINKGLEQRTMKSTFKQVFNKPFFKDNIKAKINISKQSDMIKQAQIKEQLEQSQLIQEQITRVNNMKSSKKNILLFECFIKKDRLIIYLDTNNMDILNIPLSEYFNFDYHDKTLGLNLSNKGYVYTTRTPPSKIYQVIKETLNSYYKSNKEF